MLQEVWESSIMFRETLNILPTNIMNYHFHLKIELFCRGRSIYDQSRTEYILHKAVFENNLPMISRLIKCTHDGAFYAEKNELDAAGNTPLILAIKLGNVDAVKVLADSFTCPKLKSFSNCKFLIYNYLYTVPCALDIAGALKNKEIIKILLEANQKIKQHYLDLHKDVSISLIIFRQYLAP